MKKQFICKTILLFLFFMTLFCIKTYAASSDFTYELDSNNYASITSYQGTSSNVTIPSTIDGYAVKTIANHAFNESRNDTNGKVLTNVIISEGITEIGDFAFIDCTNLESVTVPESVTDLGFQTFIGCSKLTKINIPSKVTKLQSMIFQDTGFTEFEVPENVAEMNSSFRSCDNLKKVVIYNKNLSYYSTLLSGQVVDTTPFELCSSDLVLYSYKDSTTERYANEHGITFKDIETLSADTSVESITLSKPSLSLYVGDTETITATVSPENATNKSVTWSSDNNNVATVKNGKITAISEGVATITATSQDGKNKATCNVTVNKKSTTEEDNKEIKIEKITINVGKLTLNEGGSFILATTITPENATNKTIIWSSSNENVAKVENAKVTAISEGTATITATTVDGNHVATCEVIVKKDTEVPSENKGEEVPSGDKVEKDESIAQQEIPKAGINTVLITLIIFTILLATRFNVTLKKYKDIN